MDNFVEQVKTELMNIKRDKELDDALDRLEGEVLGFDSAEGRSFRIRFGDRTIIHDDALEPTIRISASEEDILRIVRGELDPLLALVTRKIKASIDPVRGPLLRLIFFEKSARRQQSRSLV